MRNDKRDLLTIMLAICGVIFVFGVAYASVTFIGDENKVGFGAAKKVIPTVFDCPDGQAWYKGRCEKKCDRTAFSLTGTPDEVKGTIASCTDVWGTYYTYTSCHNGWDLIEGNCTETDCTGFPYTKAPESIAGTVTSCKSGTKMFYKYLSCKEGWDFANGKCTVHTCSSTTYPYNSKPSSDAGTVITCKTGAATQYGYSECRTGWDKSNGYCNIHVCDSNAFPLTSQPSSNIGTVVSCKTGNDVKYGYSACTPEYELKNGQCEIKCSLTATSLPANCSTPTESCKKNGTTYYSSTCATCSRGYKLSGNTCVVDIHTCDSSSTQVGDIYYSDDTCAATVISGKTPIGVVYNTNRKLVVALEQVSKPWNDGSSTYKDIPGLKNWSEDIFSSDSAYADYNGKSNTNTIVAFAMTSGQAHQAAQYCYNKTTGDKTWYLPALGEMGGVDSVTGVLSKVGASFSPGQIMATSTELSSQYVGHHTELTFGNGVQNEDKKKSFPVRCIFTYNPCTLTSTSSPTGCRMATDFCKKNKKTYYTTTCAVCDYGYILRNGSCVCDTSIYTQTSYTPHCGYQRSCTSNGTTRYTTCSYCVSYDCIHSPYKLSNGQCIDRTYNGLTTTWCTQNCVVPLGFVSSWKCPDGTKRTNFSVTSRDCSATNDAKCQTCYDQEMIDLQLTPAGESMSITTCDE